MDSCLVSTTYATLAPRPELVAVSGEGNHQQKQPASSILLKQHSEAEWLKMYPHIQRLYIKEGCKLRDVMVRMEREHNFKATRQMYKKRFSKWRLGKNKRRQDRLISSAPGASFPCISRGRVSNAGSSDEEYQQQQARRRMSTAVAARSSTTNPLAVSPSFSQADRSAFIVLKNIQTWNASVSEAGAWDVYMDAVALYGFSYDLPQQKKRDMMQGTFALAEGLFVRGQGTLAGKAVRKAFLMLEDVAFDGHPWTMSTLLTVLNSLRLQRRLVLLDLFITHFAGLARHKLPWQHPLLQIFAQLRFVSANTHAVHKRGALDTLVWRAWESNFDILRSDMLGGRRLWMSERLLSMNAHLVPLGSDLATDLATEVKLRNALLWMMETLKAQAARASKLNVLTVAPHIIALLLESCLAHLNSLKSPEFAHTLLRLSTSEQQDHIGAAARKVLAQMDMQAAAWGSAEEHMRGVIEFQEAAHGKNSPRVMQEVWSLETLLQKAGKASEAARARADAIERASQYLADIPEFQP